MLQSGIGKTDDLDTPSLKTGAAHTDDTSDEQELPWAKRGWLASPEYYDFWGGILARDLRPWLDGKTVADIGAGNARIWQAAFEHGLEPAKLSLIDPDLGAKDELLARPDVYAQRAQLEDVAPVKTEVAVFKQSFHLIYDRAGPAIFDMVRAADACIHFAMPPGIDWPVTETFMELFRPTCPDIRAILAENGRTIMEERRLDFPVRMDRAEWIRMVENRFISCLHDCGDDVIKHETRWARDTLPEKLEFNDTLECLIFR